MAAPSPTAGCITAARLSASQAPSAATLRAASHVALRQRIAELILIQASDGGSKACASVRCVYRTAAVCTNLQGTPPDEPPYYADFISVRRSTVLALLPPGTHFRYWIDEHLITNGSTEFVDMALAELGGFKTGGPQLAPNQRLDFAEIGVNNMDAWDLLWSIGKYAQQAASLIKPGQLVNMLPGLNMLALKKQLLLALTAAYGPEAATIAPLSFPLPEGLGTWRQWVADHPHSSSELWMLKSEDDRARGLRLVSTPDAFEVAQQPAPSKAFPRFAVAQLYVARPLLLEGRKFHVRTWVLVTGTAPLRAYLHRRGLVLFANGRYDAASAVGEDGSIAQGHITNYAQNVDGTVWALAQLAAVLGAGTWAGVWRQMLHSAALTVAAGLAPMLKDQNKYCMPPDTGFEVLGFDYLLDTSHRVWLLEVNRMPVLAARHSDLAVRAVIRDEKQCMVRDMMRMVVPRVARARMAEGSASCHEGGHMGASWQPAWATELQQRGGFVPLMPHFPLQHLPQGGAQGLGHGSLDHDHQTSNPQLRPHARQVNIPWDASDHELHQHMQAWA